MLGSMTPLGERSRNQTWWVTWAFYVLGATSAGAAIGAALAALGHLVLASFGVSNGMRAIVLAAVVVAGLLVDFGAFGLRLPTIHRQVRQDWLYAFRGWVYGLGFGAQLGVGAVTIVNTSAIYATLAAAFLTGDLLWGAVVVGTFGLLRALPIVSVARVDDEHSFLRVQPTLARLERRAQGITLAIQVVLVPAALAAAIL